MKIEGKTVVVTGAAGGIGTALITALAQRAPRCIHAVDRPGSTLRASKGVEIHELDITDHAAVERFAATRADAQILINNAGMNLRSGFIAAADLTSARSEMEVNYFGTLAMCRAFAPILAAHDGGAIANVLSILAKVTNPALGSYCASKAALLRLTEGIRAELAQQRTLVVAAMPWAVDTDMSRAFPGSKSSPDEIAVGILDAIEAGHEEVYFHEMSREINEGLASDPKALERRFASWLPRRIQI